MIIIISFQLLVSPFCRDAYTSNSSCPAGSANPDEGCELEGYHCTSSDDGCGNYVHGVCETCTTTGGSSSSDSSSSSSSNPSHKGDFKIKIIVQNANEVRSGADDVRVYIQEYPKYGFPMGNTTLAILN